MISPGVEISIAGVGGEQALALSLGRFSCYFFFFFFFLFLLIHIFFVTYGSGRLDSTPIFGQKV